MVPRTTNALGNGVIHLYKTEVIHRYGPWRHGDIVEYAMLESPDGINHRRRLKPIGNITPPGLDQAYDRQLHESSVAT